MRIRGHFRAGYFVRRLCLMVAGYVLCVSAAAFGQEQVNVQFGFHENDWSDPTTLTFATTPIATPGNSWGSEDLSDFYVETGSAADQVDALIPGPQGVVDSGLVIASFESRFLDDNQSYLAFGSDFEFENAVFFGHGGGRFYVGTGSEFDITGETPSAASVEGSFAISDAISGNGSITNDSRIGVRIGVDVSAKTLRNFQVDADNDGKFEMEFIDIQAGETIPVPDLTPEEWFLVTYAGRAGSRADDVSVIQLSSVGDYNQDLDFNELDANIICRNGIVEGDIAYDYDGNGRLEIRDVNDFAFDHGSLPADMDFDGGVNFADFLVLSGNFGQEGLYSDGDVTCNGKVDFADFLALSTFFGNEARAQTVNFNQTNAVPEPEGGCYLAAMLFGLVCVSRRR